MNDDPVIALSKELIAIPSVTPHDRGCQRLIAQILTDAGFHCRSLGEHGTDNLLALHGTGHPFTLFLGHTDVVSAGDEGAWHTPPFSPVIVNRGGTEFLCGRGSADMKGSDAAMTVALAEFVKNHPSHLGCVGLLLTSNEEGDAVGGTPFVADYLKEAGLIPDRCVVGEPSALEHFGDQIKVGRRGSLSLDVTVEGIQGHVAYPERCDNAAHHAAALMHALSAEIWDDGSPEFPPTSFQITNIRCGEGAENMVPGSCFFMCNWRFSPASDPQGLIRRFEDIASELKIKYRITKRLNGMPFVNHDKDFLKTVRALMLKHTGLDPVCSTAGGTSDGRFIAPLGTSVLELGPSGATIHKTDECVSTQALRQMQTVLFDLLLHLHNKA